MNNNNGGQKDRREVAETIVREELNGAGEVGDEDMARGVFSTFIFIFIFPFLFSAVQPSWWGAQGNGQPQGFG